MARESERTLARRLYEDVFGQGLYAVADEIMAPGCVSHGAGAPPQVGTEQIKRQAQLLRTAMPDLRALLQDQFGEGDRVVGRWTGTGTHTGEVSLPTGPVRPTGHRVSFDEIRIDRFSGGRIVESWFIPDRLSLWQQWGLL